MGIGQKRETKVFLGKKVIYGKDKAKSFLKL
jgi:hypothetical protein